MAVPRPLRFSLLAAIALAAGALLISFAFGGGSGPRTYAAAVACGEKPHPGALAGAVRERPGEDPRYVRRVGGIECEDLDRELQAPSDAMIDRLTFGSKGIPASWGTRVMREARASAKRTERYAPRVAAAEWEFVGPFNIGGRILDLALDVDDPNTIYAATAGGGVFKSTDKGVTMVSAWPNDAPQAVGAIVMTKSGVLYAGTGEVGPGGGSVTYPGDGIYKSTDKGKTWTHLPGLRDVHRIGRIVVDPTNERRLIVAAAGNLFAPTSTRGVYISEDAGETWKHSLKGDNQTSGASDVAVDPKNPKRMLAGMWDHQRFPGEKRYAGVGSGVFRTTDGGNTWARVGTGVLGPNPGLGRIGVAIDPSAPDTVYAIASGYVGGHAGFYKSIDFGTTWVQTVDPAHYGLSGAFVYGWWFGRVWVDPKKSTDVYVAGLDLLKSTNGGVSFASTSAGMHVDQHALVWDDRVSNRMWAGNDGGLYRSDTAGSQWIHSKVQPYSQPDSVDVDEKDPRKLFAGLQDNGRIRNDGKQQWAEMAGGDGEAVRANPKNPQVVHHCSQNGECQRSENGGGNSTGWGPLVSSRNLFFQPVEFDLANPDRLFSGGDIINRSDDAGESWTPISPDVSNGPSRETNPLYINNGAASAIGVVNGGQKLFVGTDDGNLWYAHSEGEIGPQDWTKLSDPDLPVAYVTRIEVDQSKPRTAYVTYSGYRGGDNAAYVLRTTDAGESWSNITGDLPKAPVNDINIVGDKLVVASDAGVYATKDGGTHWYRVGSNLPMAPIYELRTHFPSKQVFVATFGRSIWKVGFDALEGLPPAAPVDVPAVVKGPPKRKTFLGMPRTRSCKSNARLRFRVKAPKGTKLRVADVFVGSKRVARLRGSKLRRMQSLKLPRGRAKVRIIARTTTGEKLTAQRVYKACPKKKSSRRERR